MDQSGYQDKETTQGFFAALFGAAMWFLSPSFTSRAIVLFIAVPVFVYVFYKGYYVRNWSLRKRHVIAPALGTILIIAGTIDLVGQWRREHPAPAAVRSDTSPKKIPSQSTALPQQLPTPDLRTEKKFRKTSSPSQVAHGSSQPGKPVSQLGITVGDESVGMGNIPRGTKIGNKSVLVGPTDNIGNTRVGPGAYGYCAGPANPDPTSTYVGAYAGSGGRCTPAPTQAPVPFQPKQEN